MTISSSSARSSSWYTASLTRGGRASSRASRSSVITCCIDSLITSCGCGFRQRFLSRQLLVARMGGPQALHAIRHSLFQRRDQAPPHRAECEMPHEQRPRGGMFKATITQGRHHCSLVFADLAINWSRIASFPQERESEVEQRSGEISIIGMNHERDLVRVRPVSVADLHPPTQAHAQVVDKSFFARRKQRKLPAARLSNSQAGIFVAVNVFRNLHHARRAGTVQPQQSPLVMAMPAAQFQRWRRCVGGSPRQPEGQLAGVALKTTAQKQFQSSGLLIHFGEDALYPVHDSGVDSIFQKLQQHFII